MPAKRPIALPCLLAVIFAVTLTYQVRYLPDFARAEARSVPFFFTDSGSDRIAYTSPDANRLGVHIGDRLLTLNGLPYTGTYALGHAIQTTPIGAALELTLRPDGTRQDRTGPNAPERVRVPVIAAPLHSWDVFSDVVLGLFLPAVSLLLGFWVALRRPRDPMAWLLLGLMLSFPHILRSFIVQSWPAGWRVAGVLYESILEGAFPILLFLFGRYFPESFVPGSVFDSIWKGMQWLCALPLALCSLLGVIVAVGSLDHYQTVAPLRQILRPFDIAVQVWAYILIGSFFGAMGIKLGRTESPDAKRRLRFLYWGATAAFTPGLVPTLYAHLQGKNPSDLFPSWFIGLMLVPLVLFPLSLSYVIVVQKAMGVGVALRQGLQYTFARGGIRVLQWVAVTAVIVAGTTMAGNANHDRPLKTIVIFTGITAYFTIRRLGDALRIWIDRRFFRENYNAEHVLSELSEQVRTITEPKPLLETVTARISETLHIPRVAVLLDGGGAYRPTFAMGFPGLPAVRFPAATGTAVVLKQEREPARVFLKDRESWLYHNESMGEEDRATLATLGSELLLPLAVRDKLLGFISLGPKRSEEPYTRSDVRLLKSVAVQTGLALENASLLRTIAEEVAHRERLNREVEIAREVQERLFPQKLPHIVGLDYAGHCRPALGVGGDYYDFLALPQGKLGLAIGDVSGKGIAAALMMASLQASLRSEATRAPQNLAAAVASINRLVFEASSSYRYATFFYGQYDPGTGQLDYVNAGHNPPILFHRSDSGESLTRLEPGGTVVGLLEDATYEQGSIQLRPGDLLVAFTDGISEAMNLQDEEWGEDRMIDLIRATQCSSAQQLLQHLFEGATAFAGAAPQHDDMTLMVLRAFRAPVAGKAQPTQ